MPSLNYDVIIIGAGISGSVSAKILAEKGYRVLLVDGETPPREKVCSGVQLGYMEKLIGEKIPKEVLCSNRLKKIRLETPSGRFIEGSMPLLNYWRRDFDYWLTSLALDSGAETRWGTFVKDLTVDNDSAKIVLNSEKIEARYIIGGDGLSTNSITRKTLFHENFSDVITGASVNIYFSGVSLVKPDTLYLFYRKEVSDLMYSWLYYKDKILVIGTSGTKNLSQYANTFLENVKKKFQIHGDEVGRKGYTTQCKGGVLLGVNRLLLVGDAAGLLDLYRGIGMDTAALSGRLCAISISDALEGKGSALENYRQRSNRLVTKIKNNNEKQKIRYANDKAIEESLSKWNIIKGLFSLYRAHLWNQFCKPEEIILIPP